MPRQNRRRVLLDENSAPKVVAAVSAGGVVVDHTAGGIEVVLVTPYRRRVWCLPKGTLEQWESPESAAVREVREETGLQARIVDKLDDITYWFYASSTTRVHKTVHFYLMQSLGGDVTQHDGEIAEARMFPLLEALDLLAYPGERAVMEKAIDRLVGQPLPAP